MNKKSIFKIIFYSLFLGALIGSVKPTYASRAEENLRVFLADETRPSKNTLVAIGVNGDEFTMGTEFTVAYDNLWKLFLRDSHTGEDRNLSHLAYIGLPLDKFLQPTIDLVTGLLKPEEIAAIEPSILEVGNRIDQKAKFLFAVVRNENDKRAKTGAKPLRILALESEWLEAQRAEFLFNSLNEASQNFSLPGIVLLPYQDLIGLGEDVPLTTLGGKLKPAINSLNSTFLYISDFIPPYRVKESFQPAGLLRDKLVFDRLRRDNQFAVLRTRDYAIREGHALSALGLVAKPFRLDHNFSHVIAMPDSRRLGTKCADWARNIGAKLK